MQRTPTLDKECVEHQQRMDFPDVLYPDDLSAMRHAYLLARRQSTKSGYLVETAETALLILRFYRKGLVDPEKLADFATLFASSQSRRTSNPRLS
ncbi:MAG: hypothetical protein ACK4QP_03005 [Pseudorhizobium sp.]